MYAGMEDSVKLWLFVVAYELSDDATGVLLYHIRSELLSRSPLFCTCLGRFSSHQLRVFGGLCVRRCVSRASGRGTLVFWTPARGRNYCVFDILPEATLNRDMFLFGSVNAQRGSLRRGL